MSYYRSNYNKKFCNRCKRSGSHYTNQCKARTFANGAPIGRGNYGKRY